MKLITALRTATAAHHSALHIHPVLNELAGDTVTIPYYVTTLKRFYGFYAPLEPRYEKSGFKSEEFPSGPVIERLMHDLNRSSVDIKTIQIDASDARPMNSEEAIAYLYLREGSNLGGAVISKNLNKYLSLRPGTDNRFYWGHGHTAGKNWAHFLKKLSDWESHVNIEATADYAAALFQQLSAWLSEKEG